MHLGKQQSPVEQQVILSERFLFKKNTWKKNVWTTEFTQIWKCNPFRLGEFLLTGIYEIASGLLPVHVLNKIQNAVDCFTLVHLPPHLCLISVELLSQCSTEHAQQITCSAESWTKGQEEQDQINGYNDSNSDSFHRS